MTRTLCLALAALLPTLAHAQTPTRPSVTLGRVISPDDFAPAFGTKQDVNGDSSGQHVGLPGNPTLLNLLSGGSPLDLNPRPATEALPCTANGPQLAVRNSSHAQAEMMAGLFGVSVPACDGVQAILSLVPGSTAIQSNAVSGYIRNSNNNGNGSLSVYGVGVGVNSSALNTVDGAQSWLYAGIITDTGTGGSYGRLMQSELDYKPAFANTQVAGFILAMDGAAQPTNADGWIVGSTAGNPGFPGRVGRWINGFRCYDGAVALGCLSVGLAASTATGTPANSYSQAITFAFSGSDAVERTALLVASPTAMLAGRTDGLPYDLVTSGYMAAGYGLKVGGNQVLAGRSTGWGAPVSAGSKGAWDPATITLGNLAQVVAALETALTTHGLIGP